MGTHPQIEVVNTFSHADGLRWAGDWADIDVAIIDAADEREPGDQFPGAQVVNRIREGPGESRPIVVIVTGHFFNDGLRRRMAEAGADFFFQRAQIREPNTLIDLVLHPDQFRRGVPKVADHGLLAGIGVSDRSRVEQLVSYVNDHDLGDALDPAGGGRENPRGRQWSTHRKAIADVAAIRTVNLTTGFTPSGNQRYPSLRQLARIFGWATKVHEPAHPLFREGQLPDSVG